MMRNKVSLKYKTKNKKKPKKEHKKSPRKKKTKKAPEKRKQKKPPKKENKKSPKCKTFFPANLPKIQILTTRPNREPYLGTSLISRFPFP